jgi:hypothetical protein
MLVAQVLVVEADGGGRFAARTTIIMGAVVGFGAIAREFAYLGHVVLLLPTHAAPT